MIRSRIGLASFLLLSVLVALWLRVRLPDDFGDSLGTQQVVELEDRRRVRVAAPTLGSGWRTGFVGRIGMRGQTGCIAIFVPEGDAGPRMSVVPFDVLTGLQVSNRLEPEGSSQDGAVSRGVGASSQAEPEIWTTVPAEAVKARYGRCNQASN